MWESITLRARKCRERVDEAHERLFPVETDIRGP